MKRQLGKKLLAMLLAVMLIASVMPLNVLAAEPTMNMEPVSGAEDYIHFNVTASDAFGSASNPSIASISAYNSSRWRDLDDTASAANQLAYVEKVYAGKKEANVNKGTEFYVGVKASIGNKTAGTGVVKYSVVLTYDPTVVEPAYTAAGQIATNAANNGNLVVEGEDRKSYYCDSTKLTVGRPVTINESTRKAVGITVAASGDYAFPSAANWDIVVPFKAIGTGTTEINCVKTTAVASVNSFADIMKVENGSKDVEYLSATKGEVKNIAAASPEFGNHYSSSGAIVNITSNEYGITASKSKVAVKEERTIDVTLDKSCTWKGTPAFEIVNADGTSLTPALTPNSVTTSGAKASLTFDGSKLTAGSKYKVKVTSTLSDVVTKPATNAPDDPATLISGEFEACAPLSGTASVDGDTYGDTIKASITGGNVAQAGTLSYSWSVGDAYNPSAKYSTNASGVAPATYVAASGFTVGTSKMTFRITSADLDNTFVDVTSDEIGKKELEFKAGDTVALDAILENAPAGQQTKSFTFKTANGIVGSDSVSVDVTGKWTTADTAATGNNKTLTDVTVGALGTSAPASYYTIKSGSKPTVTVTVAPISYQLAGADMTFVDNANPSGGNITEVKTGGVTIKGTWSGSVPAGQELTGFTVKVGDAAATAIPAANVDLTAKTFTYALPTTDPTGVVTYTFAPAYGTAATPVEFTGLDKDYDGTDTFEGSITTSGITLEDCGITSIVYSSADAGATLVVTPSTALGKTFDKNGTKYQVPAALTGTINQIAATTVTATAEQVREGATIDDVVNAILGADVVANGITQDKVSAYADADDIKELLKDVEGLFDEGTPKTEVTLAADTDVTTVTIDANSVAGSTWTFPAGATFVGADGTTELTAGELAALGFTKDGTKLTLGAEEIAAAGTITVKYNDGTTDKTITINVGAVTPKEEVAESWNIVPGDYSVTITTDGSIGKLGTNFTGTPSITASISVKKKGAAGGIVYNTNGYAAASEDEVQVEDGKIVALAEVTDVVKGASFLGWSTDGTKAHIVKVGAEVSEEQEELIAVFEGYMMGTTPTTMVPTHQITRAQLLKMVLVASGEYDANHDYGKCEKFTDSNDGWYTPYVACAEKMENPIISGYEDGTFKPNRVVKREEAAKIIAEAFGVEVKKGATTDKVTDFDKVSGWAKDYVAALCENGTISGFKDGTFGGARGIQRDAASKMVNMYLGLTDADRTAIKANAEIKNPFTDISKGNWAYADLMFASLSVSSDFYQTEITMPNATPATPAE